MAHDNYIDVRGYGDWTIYTYNPSDKTFNVRGWLLVSRDYHAIYENYDNSSIPHNCLLSIPSPNIAAAINELKK